MSRTNTISNLIYVVALVGLAAIVCFFYMINVAVNRSNIAYAFASLGDATVAYLRDNENKWPDCKKCFRPYYDRKDIDFDELEKYFVVDYQLETSEIMEELQKETFRPETFQPITFKTPPARFYRDANQIILDYLLSEAAKLE